MGSRAQAQYLWHMCFVAPRHVGSSRTRARTCVPCTGRRILNHCATREAPGPSCFKDKCLGPVSTRSCPNSHLSAFHLNLTLPYSSSSNPCLKFHHRNCSLLLPPTAYLLNLKDTFKSLCCLIYRTTECHIWKKSSTPPTPAPPPSPSDGRENWRCENSRCSPFHSEQYFHSQGKEMKCHVAKRVFTVHLTIGLPG